MLHRTLGVLLAGIFGLGIVIAYTAPAEAQLAACRDYASRAVEQNRRNERLGCGFTGDRWQGEASAHFLWCMAAPASQRRAETRARERMLRECASGGRRAECRDYANTAVRQNENNERLGCGFSGARWQSNFDNHFDWCMRASEADRNRETRARRDQLESCRGGGGGRRAECRNYANTAVRQNENNERLGCGFSGARWQSNFDNHFDWCMRASEAQRNRESRARRDQLESCRGGGGGRAAQCRDYADIAVGQNERNERLGCGFSGARWQSNWDNHFDWCMRASETQRNRETEARREQLDRCAGGGGGRRTFLRPRMGGHIVDHCRTWATDCGEGGANLFCRRQGYERAAEFERFRPGSTYVIGSDRVCRGDGCVGFRSVTCVGRR